MARNRSTVEHLERTGALKRNPGRYAWAASVPVCKDPLGPPPADFTPELVDCWNVLLEATAPVKLVSADRLHVEMTARLILHTRQPGANAAWFRTLAVSMGKFGIPNTRTAKSEPADNDEDGVWAAMARGECPM